MAKALIGHLPLDPRAAHRLAAENLRLRARVVALEALVLRLQEEADRDGSRRPGSRQPGSRQLSGAAPNQSA